MPLSPRCQAWPNWLPDRRKPLGFREERLPCDSGQSVSARHALRVLPLTLSKQCRLLLLYSSSGMSEGHQPSEA